VSKIEITEKPHVFIGVPSLDGRITVELHRYLAALQTLGATGQLPFTVSVGELTGHAPVTYARNVLCAMALQTAAERMVQIDADMLPNDSCSRVLTNFAADIVCPRMFRFRHSGDNGIEDKPPEVAACATLVRDGKRYDVIPKPDSGLARVNGCGTGFISIARQVLLDPRMRVGPDVDGVPALFKFEYDAVGGITEWEDVDFTLRADALGYSVVADFSAHCGHKKTINLDCVWEMVYGQKPATVEMAR
jgi:hypothetical protein